MPLGVSYRKKEKAEPDSSQRRSLSPRIPCRSHRSPNEDDGQDDSLTSTAGWAYLLPSTSALPWCQNTEDGLGGGGFHWPSPALPRVAALLKTIPRLCCSPVLV